MKRTLAMLSALLLSSGIALATDMKAGESHPAAGFSGADKDSNGLLTMEEAKSVKGLTEAYKDVDANADGTIVESEFSAFETWQSPQPALPESTD